MTVGDFVRMAYCLVSCVAVAVCLGCSREPPMGELRGQVTLDSQPLNNGIIRFIPIDGESQTAGGTIENGAFEIRLPVKKHRVEISATKMPTGAAAAAGRHSDANFAVVELVPAKYNVNSSLNIDVRAGRNEPRFDLQSRNVP
jgi:hypothetical protein